MKGTKADKICDYFLKSGETISVAESVTAGMLQQFFASLEEAAKFFQGGITTYNIGQKYRHLKVEPIHAAVCNCVSEKVVEQMAANVCQLFTSDWGIGITGYATPVPESGNKLFCYYAICYKGTIKDVGIIKSKRMAPAKVQELYVKEIVGKYAYVLGVV